MLLMGLCYVTPFSHWPSYANPIHSSHTTTLIQRKEKKIARDIMSRWPVARCRRRRSCCRLVPAAATRGPGRRTPSRLRLLLCLIYKLGFRGVAIRVAKENGGTACAWPSSAGWLCTFSHCASSRWAHLPVREGGVLLACALHVSGGPRVRHHGFIGSDQYFRQENC